MKLRIVYNGSISGAAYAVVKSPVNCDVWFNWRTLLWTDVAVSATYADYVKIVSPCLFNGQAIPGEYCVELPGFANPAEVFLLDQEGVSASVTDPFLTSTIVVSGGGSYKYVGAPPKQRIVTCSGSASTVEDCGC